MLALLDANRTAFINENVNLVRAGSILRVPRGAATRARSQAQALAEIGRQGDLWREYRDNLRGTTANTRVADRGAPAADDAPEPTEVADAGADGASGVPLDGSSPAGEENALSPEARQILESAREEVRNRNELRIVAGESSSETGANATDDRETDDQGARLGEIDRQLQLAREELSSSRLEGGELDEQASELQSTSENLDALVALRQNEIARLESQLATARANGDEAGATAATGDDGRRLARPPRARPARSREQPTKGARTRRKASVPRPIRVPRRATSPRRRPGRRRGARRRRGRGGRVRRRDGGRVGQGDRRRGRARGRRGRGRHLERGERARRGSRERARRHR